MVLIFLYWTLFFWETCSCFISFQNKKCLHNYSSLFPETPAPSIHPQQCWQHTQYHHVIFCTDRDVSFKMYTSLPQDARQNELLTAESVGVPKCVTSIWEERNSQQLNTAVFGFWNTLKHFPEIVFCIMYPFTRFLWFTLARCLHVRRKVAPVAEKKCCWFPCLVPGRTLVCKR